VASLRASAMSCKRCWRPIAVALLLGLGTAGGVFAQDDFSRRGHHPSGHPYGRGVNHFRHAPAAQFHFFQRPYPYHLDYYRMKYGGGYDPYFGNLYGPPQFNLFYGPQFNPFFGPPVSPA